MCRVRNVLANDEIINGVSERGGYAVTKKKMKQWSMRIGAYAERLLQGLDKIDWPDSLKEMQRNWIGKSVGAKVRFQIENRPDQLEVFTTRPDTIYGVTFMTLAPELELVKAITTAEQKEVVEAYVESLHSDQKEIVWQMSKPLACFTGAYALHPLTQERVPIWIGIMCWQAMELEQLWQFLVGIKGTMISHSILIFQSKISLQIQTFLKKLMPRKVAE